MNRRAGGKALVRDLQRNGINTQNLLRQMTPEQRKKYKRQQWLSIFATMGITFGFFLVIAAVIYWVRMP